MDFSAWALKNKPLVWFVVFLLTAGGMISALNMSKLEDPAIAVKSAVVLVTQPGASAHQVELESVDPVEKAILSLPEVNTVKSKCYNDMAIIQINLNQNVQASKLTGVWQRLRNKVNDVALPAGATIRVLDDFGDVYGIFYAMTGDGLTGEEMSKYAQLVKREIGAVKGVGKVQLYGTRQNCIDIALHQDRLSEMGLSVAEVLGVLQGQDATAYSGYLISDGSRLRVNVDGKYQGVRDIENLVIQGHSGDIFRLGDIADVTEVLETPLRNCLTYDGEEAIGILISANEGTDILKVGKSIEKELSRLKSDQLPVGVELHSVFYQPERVGAALGDFFINLIESILVVILILVVFMGLRSSLIIGLCLLVTVIGSFVILNVTGGTMQRVSLASFILAMGMLVDNSIVIIDGILVDLKQGKSRHDALTDIGRKTAMPLLGATMIAILAFLPLAISKDTTGDYIRDLFIVLAVSLLLSWVLALLLVPILADRSLRVQNGAVEKPNRLEMVIRRLLDFSMRHRWGTVVVMVLLLGLTFVGYGYMKQGFFPDMKYDQLYITYKSRENSDWKHTAEALESMREYLAGCDDILHVTASTGGTPGRYNLVRGIGPNSMSYGELIVDFKDAKRAAGAVDELQAYMDAHYPDAYVRVKRYNLMYMDFPVEVQFSGPDPAVLHRLTEQALAVMDSCPQTVAATSDWDSPVPNITVHYDQPQARQSGLSRKDVSISLLSATDGIPIGYYYDGLRRKKLNVRVVSANGEAVDNLATVHLFSQLPSLKGLLSEDVIIGLATGTMDINDIDQRIGSSVPLGQVGSGIEIGWEDPCVNRMNGQRAQRAQCFPAYGCSAADAYKAVKAKVAQMDIPASYSVKWYGEQAASSDSVSSLFGSYPAAILIIILILILLFGDYKKPAIIIITVPLVLIGVVAAMLVSGKPFGFVAIAGVLGLVGMMIKNDIVLMDEIDRRIANGEEPYSALIEGSVSRVRAVSMAALTTIFGMLPLLGDVMFGSLAACIMGGLAFGTILTLVFVPVLYSLFFKIRKA
ncbi:MAG: efflux RND transporter permease subunit [Bacteroidales bacterium]|nr:efflux RND transporter permease subunit [Bacteroidales bacterium]